MFSTSQLLAFLLIMSITGSILYLFVKITSSILINYEVRFHYTLMKIVMIFLLLPAFVIIMSVAVSGFHIIKNSIFELDFHYIEIFMTGKGFTMLGFELLFNYIINAIFIIWIFGTVIFLLRQLLLSIFLRYSLIKSSEVCSDATILSMKSLLMKELNIHKDVLILENSTIDGPFTIGIINCIIVIPKEILAEKNLIYILRHEFVHVKKKDILFKNMMGVIRAFHWYNPFVLLYTKNFYDCSEYACDETVMKNEGKEVRGLYARLLIEMSRANHNNRNIVSFATEEEKKMKQRVYHIAVQKKKLKLPSIIFILAFFITLCPITTYTASSGFLNVYNNIINDVIAERSVKRMSLQSDGNEEYAVFNENSIFSNQENFEVHTDGMTELEINLPSNKKIYSSITKIQEGGFMRLFLKSENEEDTFIAGVIDVDNNTEISVSSTNGLITHSFDIDTSSEYILYISGENESSEHEISLIGNLLISK